MKGHLGKAVWTWVMVNVVALFAVLGLAYGAGARSGGLTILDFGALSRNAGLELLGALMVTVAMGFALLIFLGNRILRPVKELADASEKLAAGEYGVRAYIDSNDDFAFIAENVNRVSEDAARVGFERQTQESLHRSIADFSDVAAQLARGDMSVRGTLTNDPLASIVESLNSTLDNLSRILERQRRAGAEICGNANQVLDTAEKIGMGTSQQEQELVGVTAALEQLAVSIKHACNNADAGVDAGRRVVDAAEQANRALAETLESFRDIRASMQATSKQVRGLGDRSLELLDLVNVINDLTHESKFLALNTALETPHAAKSAGLAGVADEVRNLSEFSRNCSKDIVALMKSLQGATNEILGAMEESSRQVEVGARLAEQAGKSLETLSGSVRQSSGMAQEVALASREQVRGAESIAASLQTIARISRQNSEGARQTAHTAEQMARLSEQLTQALLQFRTGAALPGSARAEAAIAAATAAVGS